MIYAPVIIPTLCRYEHFVRCIESLRKNTFAKFTEVYVGIDYPAKPAHEEGYTKICEYLDNDFPEFAALYVIKHDTNVGASNNSKKLREAVEQKYDRYIRTDDDIEFSPNFLEYMNKALTLYENDDRVIAVTGYSYPIKWEVSDDSTIFFNSAIVPVWGIGFWCDKINPIREYISSGGLIESFDESRKNGVFKKMTDACRIEYITGCLSEDNNGPNQYIKKMSDITLRMYCAVKDVCVISPVITKARNHGFDGSGQCQAIDTESISFNSLEYNYGFQPIDDSPVFELIPDTKKSIVENRLRLNKFDKKRIKSKIKVMFKLMLYCTLGKKIYYGIRRMFLG